MIRIPLKSIFSFLFLPALLLSGCATERPPAYDADKANIIDNIMNSWVGHYESELIAAWGQPTKVIEDKQGGRVLEYKSLKGTWGETTDKRIVGGAQFKAQPRQEGYAAIRIFHVDEDGIIRSWKWEGL